MRKALLVAVASLVVSACSGSAEDVIGYVSETVSEAGQEMIDLHVGERPIAYRAEVGLNVYESRTWQWIKVTSKSSGPMAFLVEWEKPPTPYWDVVAEEYVSPFSGEPSERSPIATHVRNYESEDGANWLSSFTREMEADVPAYFRIRGDAFESSRPYSFACYPGGEAPLDGYERFDGPLYEEPEPFLANITDSRVSSYASFGYFDMGECGWAKFVSETSGTCHFVFQYSKTSAQGPSLIAEEFPTPFGGYDSEGRLALHEVNYLCSIGTKQYWIIYFTKSVSIGDIIYFRVRYAYFHRCGTVFIFANINAPQFDPGATITEL